jgi:hypothetical protein
VNLFHFILHFRSSLGQTTCNLKGIGIWVHVHKLRAGLRKFRAGYSPPKIFPSGISESQTLAPSSRIPLACPFIHSPCLQYTSQSLTQLTLVYNQNTFTLPSLHSVHLTLTHPAYTCVQPEHIHPAFSTLHTHLPSSHLCTTRTLAPSTTIPLACTPTLPSPHSVHLTLTHPAHTCVQPEPLEYL